MLDGQIIRVKGKLSDFRSKYPDFELQDGDPVLIFHEESESLIGLGFVALQEFITSRLYNVKKNMALGFGPEITPGLTLSQIINDAANYFKHHEEWRFNQHPSRLAIEAHFKMLGIEIDNPQSPFPLLNLLGTITNSERPSFTDLLPNIWEWWNNISHQHDKQVLKEQDDKRR